MTLTAAELMTAPAVTAHPEASLAEVAKILVGKKITAIPICNPDGTLAGVISEADVVRPFRESLLRKRQHWLELLANGEDLSQDFLDYLRQDTKPARDMMTKHVVTASKDATLPELAELMISHGVKRIPIVDSGKVIGIVSRSDLLRAISKQPALMV